MPLPKRKMWRRNRRRTCLPQAPERLKQASAAFAMIARESFAGRQRIEAPHLQPCKMFRILRNYGIVRTEPDAKAFVVGWVLCAESDQKVFVWRA